MSRPYRYVLPSLPNEAQYLFTQSWMSKSPFSMRCRLLKKSSLEHTGGWLYSICPLWIRTASNSATLALLRSLPTTASQRIDIAAAMRKAPPPQQASRILPPRGMAFTMSLAMVFLLPLYGKPRFIKKLLKSGPTTTSCATSARAPAWWRPPGRRASRWGTWSTRLCIPLSTALSTGLGRRCSPPRKAE